VSFTLIEEDRLEFLISKADDACHERDEVRDIARWLYWRVAHYSQGVPDIQDVPKLERLKALDWIHEKD